MRHPSIDSENLTYNLPLIGNGARVGKLRPIHTKRVYVRGRPSTDVDALGVNGPLVLTTNRQSHMGFEFSIGTEIGDLV